MTHVYFSADLHGDHANIIKYANRPFLNSDSLNKEDEWISTEEKYRCCSWMNEILIKNWNNKVNPDDVVYHVGDFCFGSGGHDKFTSRLNGVIVHVKGNHDSNNGVKSYLHSGIFLFGGLEVYVVHVPPRNPGEIPNRCDLVLHGHVHNAWKSKIMGDTPMINVGVDVWDYEPVSVESVLKLYNKLTRRS